MKFLIGCVLAALVSFTWGYVSWEVLGWHKNNTFGFKNEADVAEVLLKNVVNGSGTYVLPHQGEPPSVLPPEEKTAKIAAAAKARDDGPYMMATIRPGKKPFKLGVAMGLSFGRSVLACLLLGALLAGSSFSYAGKVAFCAAAGAFAGMAAEVPDWIWFELRGANLFVAFADQLFEWTLAGTVLAGFVGKPPMAINEVD
jgi:hypothetical protein